MSRTITVLIEETINYCDDYSEEHIAQVFDFTIDEVQNMSDDDIRELFDDTNPGRDAIEDDLQGEGDVQGGVWTITVKKDTP